MKKRTFWVVLAEIGENLDGHLINKRMSVIAGSREEAIAAVEAKNSRHGTNFEPIAVIVPD